MDKKQILLTLAPMAGITAKSYRQLFRQIGKENVDLYYTEMISCTGLIMGNSTSMGMLPYGEEKVLVQLFGAEPEEFEKGADIALSRTPQLEGIDINAACPVKKVIKKGCGAALARDEKNLRDILRTLRKKLPEGKKKLSLKIRKGWDEDINYKDLILAAQDEGADFVVLHGRTVEQKYLPFADDSILAGLLNSISIPLFWSGDIFKEENALKIVEKYPVSGILIARGGMGNPWIFEKIKNGLSGEMIREISIEEKIKAVELHIDLMLKDYSAYKTAAQFKKFISGYTFGIPFSREKRNAIMQVKKLKDMKEMIIETIVVATRNTRFSEEGRNKGDVRDKNNPAYCNCKND